MAGRLRKGPPRVSGAGGADVFFFGVGVVFHTFPLVLGGTVKDVQCILTFPKQVKSLDVKASIGAVTFPPEQQGDYVVRKTALTLGTQNFAPNLMSSCLACLSQTCFWDIGVFSADKSPRLTGTLALQAGAKPLGASVTATMRFVVGGGSISKLRIKDMSVVNEAYKVKKGMRTMVRAGRVQVRGV